MPRTLRILLVVSAAWLLAVVGAVDAMGYIKQSQLQVLVSGPSGVVRCDRSATISARVVSAKSGKAVPNQVVTWRISQSQSGGDHISATRTETNRQGQTSVTLTFGPVAGSRSVRAAAGGDSAGVSVRCAGGLPETSTLPPPGFEDVPSTALVAPPSVTVDAPAAPLATLRIDRLGIDLPVVEGDGVTVPDGAAAHYPGTAWPGQGSNTYVYGHAREGHLLALWKVRTGDVVEMDMADGDQALYRVSEIRPMVAWDALDMLAPTSDERLTLQTCLSYADTAPRFVVIAERIQGA